MMIRPLLRIVAVAALLAAAATSAAAQTGTAGQDLPRFTSSVDLTSLDISVVDAAGRPVADLTPEEFTVQIDGTPRRVVTAEWVPLGAPVGPAAAPAPPGYSSNETATGGRLLLIVIDQPNIRFGGTMAIRKAVNDFIDQLQPSDRAAIIGIGQASGSTPFTADRARLKQAVARMNGQIRPDPVLLHNIGLAEALDARRGIPGVLDGIIARECRELNGSAYQGPDLDACVFEVERETQALASNGVVDGLDSIRTLRSLLTALRTIDAPKTMLFVSEGFIMNDDIRSVTELGTLAAAARTSIYAIRLDDDLMARAAAETRLPLSRMQDRFARTAGLEALVKASRGALMNVSGSGQIAFERIRSELTGYYLVGVESEPVDRDGKPHPIRVSVSRKGITVRTRQALLVSPDALTPARGPREAVAMALSTPLPLAALPMRLAAFSLQGPEFDKVQVLIHADIGTDYTASRVAAVGYVITDREGRVVENRSSGARLVPMMNGVPSPLRYSAGASLPPGDYVIKLAVAEGDRVGTVEHGFHAGTSAAGDLLVSDLMVGGPPRPNEAFIQPTIGYDVVFGLLKGYVEAYGADVRSLRARYEIVDEVQGSVLLGENVAPMLAGGGVRAIFSHMMPVRQLPPGRYDLRVTLMAEGAPVKSLQQPFEVSAPAVLMASAVSGALPATDVYLPVSDLMLQPGFDPGEAARPATVQSFRERVNEQAREAFDQGVRALAAGAYGDAEASFKRAISADEENAAVLSYMAATFAASGHDLEAASAWQTALVDGSDFPEIYDWLARALMRSRDLAMAKSTLEEAMEKWPGDDRFTRSMAAVYATLGQGQEAVRVLERYLDGHGEDPETLALGVEWIYQLRSAGVAARTPADDAALARRYAAAYTRMKGPKTTLVKQWMDFIEKKKP